MGGILMAASAVGGGAVAFEIQPAVQTATGSGLITSSIMTPVPSGPGPWAFLWSIDAADVAAYLTNVPNAPTQRVASNDVIPGEFAQVVVRCDFYRASVLQGTATAVVTMIRD